MKKLIGIVVILAGCTVTMKPDADTLNMIRQQQVVTTAVVQYLHDLQKKGVLPNVVDPTPTPEAKK